MRFYLLTLELLLFWFYFTKVPCTWALLLYEFIILVSLRMINCTMLIFVYVYIYYHFIILLHWIQYFGKHLTKFFIIKLTILLLPSIKRVLFFAIISEPQWSFIKNSKYCTFHSCEDHWKLLQYEWYWYLNHKHPLWIYLITQTNSRHGKGSMSIVSIKAFYVQKRRNCFDYLNNSSKF